MKVTLPDHLIKIIKEHPETDWDEIISIVDYKINLSDSLS